MNPPTEPNIDPFAVDYSLPFDLSPSAEVPSAFLGADSQAPFDWTQFEAGQGFAEQGALRVDDLLVVDGVVEHGQLPIAGPSTGVDEALAEGITVDPAGAATTNPTKPIHRRPPRPAKPPPPGSILADRSCARCRERKVKCDRVFPQCRHCKQRREDCDLATWAPKPPKPKETDPERIAFLEKRLAELEKLLAAATLDPTLPSALPLPPATTQLLNDPPVSHDHATQARRAAPPTFGAMAIDSPGSSDASSKEPVGVLDLKLATPLMRASLQKSLCEAFFQSCCFVLPTFSYWRPRVQLFADPSAELTPAQRVARAAFIAVGARASSHSSLLGIEIAPGDSKPVLAAGRRRENAVASLAQAALRANFEEGLADQATPENLASLLAACQMCLFSEFEPRKSRSLHRASLAMFKELSEGAASVEALAELKQTFGLAIYTTDGLISAYSRRICSVSDADLRSFFSNMGIVVPKLPGLELLPALKKLVANSEALGRDAALRTGLHLVQCWVCAAQRVFARLWAPPAKTLGEIEEGLTKLWELVDHTRESITYCQSVVAGSGGHAHDHTHPHEGVYQDHDLDFGPRLIRLDRDLLDLSAMAWQSLQAMPRPGLPGLEEVVESRVRKALRVQAFYAQIYCRGTDLHMVFHHFHQLEQHNPAWARMALQKLGEGPKDPSEVCTEMERKMLIDGLELMSFYSPMAEKRLAELAPRFEQVEGGLGGGEAGGAIEVGAGGELGAVGKSDGYKWHNAHVRV